MFLLHGTQRGMSMRPASNAALCLQARQWGHGCAWIRGTQQRFEHSAACCLLSPSVHSIQKSQHGIDPIVRHLRWHALPGRRWCGTGLLHNTCSNNAIHNNSLSTIVLRTKTEIRQTSTHGGQSHTTHHIETSPLPRRKRAHIKRHASLSACTTDTTEWLPLPYFAFVDQCKEWRGQEGWEQASQSAKGAHVKCSPASVS